MRNQILWSVVIGLHVAAAAMAGGCQPSLGVVCGKGWCSDEEICVGAQTAQPVCVRASCGNDHVELGEECDDGNNTGGDRCSLNCMFERCGNGFQEFGELCDDGNTWGGDGCSDDCHSIEDCGNEILDRAAGEQCDDGNTTDGDGCTARCKLPSCGNGILDPYEQCDDGNTVDGDGCSSDCRSAESCGNGNLDPGEECDDGKTPEGESRNGDDKECRSDCVINRCGDGRENIYGLHHEDCDGGDRRADNDRTAKPRETAACNFNCTTATCGDGIVNPHYTNPGAPGPEQCDPPSVAGGCSANCRFGHCGSGVKDTGEECDGTDFGPGGNPNRLVCAADCHIEDCGNGRLDPGEQCDDRNGASGDGCTGGLLPAGGCRFEFCGDNVVNNDSATRNTHEDCDDGGANSATCNFDCTTPRCRDGIVNPLFTKEGAPGPEQCDPPSIARGSSSGCRFISAVLPGSRGVSADRL